MGVRHGIEYSALNSHAEVEDSPLANEAEFKIANGIGIKLHWIVNADEERECFMFRSKIGLPHDFVFKFGTDFEYTVVMNEETHWVSPEDRLRVSCLFLSFSLLGDVL